MAKYIPIGALIALLLGLIGSVLMVVYPRKNRKVADRSTGLALLGIILFFMIRPVVSALLHGKVISGSVPKSTPSGQWRFLVPLTLLVMGIVTFLRPQLSSLWVQAIRPDRPLSEREKRQAARAGAIILIVGGLIFLSFALGIYPNTYFLLFLFSMFWIGSGIYITARPERFLVNTQYPWNLLPVWGAKILGALIFLTGVVMLRIFILHSLN